MEAKKSKCWSCRFGLCVNETENEKVYHAGMQNLDNDNDTDAFGVMEGMSYREDNGDENDLIEHTVEHERVKSICFWRPEGINDSPPILVQFIQECNRFQKK